MSQQLHAPVPFSWGEYVASLVAERGSLAELARHLRDVAPSLTADPSTVERGLRRLQARGTSPGETYGRLLLRHIGLPRPITEQARELGQYHSRWSDLPLPARREQLRLWDRPPISESGAAAWVHLALGSLAMTDGDLAQVERRLELARLGVRRAGREAAVELALFEARVRSDREDGVGADRALAEAAAGLAAFPDGEAAACYRARLHDQRGYRAARGWREHPSRPRAALAEYEAIPEGGPAFAAFRRAHGVAWCRWRMGDHDGAAAAANQASQYAGDGGFLRFRVQSLTLLASILQSQGRPADALLARVAAMQRSLEGGPGSGAP